MMNWNYRVIRLKVGDEYLYKLAEVYYADDGKAESWSDPFLEGSSVEEIQEVLDRAMAGSAKPVLDMEFGTQT